MATAVDVIGRERECAQVRDWLSSPEALPAALIVTGDPGIGKTTLAVFAIAAARERGYHVVSASPGTARLQFETLGDLLAADLGSVRGGIPQPQIRALEVALVLREADGPPPDPRAIALGALSAFRALATRDPLLIVIDDAQWLDPASNAALTFVFRRLAGARTALLIASRDDVPPFELHRGLAPERRARIHMGPLSIGAIHALLRDQLRLSLRRPTLQRIHELAAGNPFHALELAMAMNRSPDGDAAALPASLGAAMRARLAALPHECADALAVASLCADPTTTLLRRVLEADVAERLAPAIAADLVAVADDRLRFTHPLLASAAAETLPADAKREWHRKLAHLAPTLEERALHTAYATDAPDADAAAMLEEAAGAAARRGAPAAAAEMSEHALRLTDPTAGADRRSRAALGARYFWTAGDYDRGRSLIDRALQDAAGQERAQLLFMLASNPRNLDESRALCEEALAAASSDRALRARIFGWLALLSYASVDLASALGHARAAIDAAASCGDAVVVEEALARMRFLQILHGEPVSLDDIAVAAERQLRERGIVQYGPAELYLLALLWSDDLERAREFGERLDAIARDSGSIARTTILNYLGQAAYRAGDWSRAQRLVDEAVELASQYGVEHLEAEALAHQALLDASLGRTENARGAAERGLALAVATAEPLGEIRHRAVLGFIALSSGNDAAAARELGAALDIVRRGELRNPAAHFTVIAPAIAAFVATGEVARADSATRELEDVASQLRTPRALALAARCRGLVSAARGELEGAIDALARSVEHHATLPVPFELALTLLAQGQVQRRAKQKKAARGTLTRALEIFERLPAPLWAAKAQRELARIGGRRASAGELTVSEERIAALVAHGKSNKEVAAAVFVNVATVEAALTRIYQKLGVRSRAELAHVMSATGTQAGAGKH